MTKPSSIQSVTPHAAAALAGGLVVAGAVAIVGRTGGSVVAAAYMISPWLGRKVEELGAIYDLSHQTARVLNRPLPSFGLDNDEEPGTWHADDSVPWAPSPTSWGPNSFATPASAWTADNGST